MTPAAQAFYDACCAGKEWDLLMSLCGDLSNADIASLELPSLAQHTRPFASRYDPYRWTTIQPQIDREIHANREGVRDHYAWRNPWLNR